MKAIKRTNTLYFLITYLLLILPISALALVLEDYSLGDLPSIPTQISVLAKNKNFSQALEYCNSLKTDNSDVYQKSWMVEDKNKEGDSWRLPTYLEMLSALLLDRNIGNMQDTLVGDSDSDDYLWTIDTFSPVLGKNQTSAERLVIKPLDREWYYDNEKMSYNVRCVR
ncbi:hypothetical protein OAT97_00295 [Gammaproteobacteria bacterium]|nr:hypothetical protein [Gammaproteobacteria bacterium]